MKNYLLLLLMVPSMMCFAQTTTHQYDLSIAGIIVGSLTASKQIEGHQERYTADSEAAISFFGKHTLKTHLVAVYEHGILLNSHNTMWKNGEIDEELTVKRIGDNYEVNYSGEVSMIQQPIPYSSICLYFQQPKNIKEVFYEPDAIFRKITNTKTNAYRLVENDKYTNSYIYDDQGVLQSVIFESGLFDVSILLKK